MLFAIFLQTVSQGCEDGASVRDVFRDEDNGLISTSNSLAKGVEFADESNANVSDVHDCGDESEFGHDGEGLGYGTIVLGQDDQSHRSWQSHRRS